MMLLFLGLFICYYCYCVVSYCSHLSNTIHTTLQLLLLLLLLMNADDVVVVVVVVVVVFVTIFL